MTRATRRREETEIARSVIFDLDGVLVDSEPYWREGFRAGIAHVAAELGRPRPRLTDAALKRYEGGRVPDTLKRLSHALFGGAEAPEAVLRTATRIAIDTASRLFTHDPKPIVPSVETAQELAQEGYVLAVASSSAPRFISAALQAVGLADQVRAVESAFALERGKPDPLVYQNALRAIGATPQTAVAIEDSLVGVEAALRAGLPTLWLSLDRRVTLPQRLLEELDPSHLVQVAEVRSEQVRELFSR